MVFQKCAVFIEPPCVCVLYEYLIYYCIAQCSVPVCYCKMFSFIAMMALILLADCHFRVFFPDNRYQQFCLCDIYTSVAAIVSL